MIFGTFYLSINFFKMMLLYNLSDLKFNIKISLIYIYEFWIIFKSFISMNQVNKSLGPYEIHLIFSQIKFFPF